MDTRARAAGDDTDDVRRRVARDARALDQVDRERALAAREDRGSVDDDDLRLHFNDDVDDIGSLLDRDDREGKFEGEIASLGGGAVPEQMQALEGLDAGLNPPEPDDRLRLAQLTDDPDAALTVPIHPERGALANMWRGVLGKLGYEDPDVPRPVTPEDVPLEPEPPVGGLDDRFGPAMHAIDLDAPDDAAGRYREAVYVAGDVVPRPVVPEDADFGPLPPRTGDGAGAAGVEAARRDDAITRLGRWGRGLFAGRRAAADLDAAAAAIAADDLLAGAAPVVVAPPAPAPALAAVPAAAPAAVPAAAAHGIEEFGPALRAIDLDS